MTFESLLGITPYPALSAVLLAVLAMAVLYLARGSAHHVLLTFCQAVREAEEALVNLDATNTRTADADAAVKNYQASFDATQARYSSGLASLFELEDSRRTLFTAQTARVTLQRERTEAWVALYRSMGGGWNRQSAAAPSSSESTSMTTTPTAKVATSP